MSLTDAREDAVGDGGGDSGLVTGVAESLGFPGIGDKAAFDEDAGTIVGGEDAVISLFDAPTFDAAVFERIGDTLGGLSAFGAWAAGHIDGGPRSLTIGRGIDMDRDKQISLGSVGDFGAFVKFEETVIRTRINNVDATVSKNLSDLGGDG